MRSARHATYEQFWVLAPLEELRTRVVDSLNGSEAVAHEVRRKITALGFPDPSKQFPLKYLRPRLLWQRGRLVGQCIQWAGGGQPYQATLAPAAIDVLGSTTMDWLHLRGQCGASHASLQSSLSPWQQTQYVRVPLEHRLDPMPWLVSHVHAQLRPRWLTTPTFDFEVAAVHAPDSLQSVLAQTTWTPQAVEAWWHFMGRWVSRLDAVVSLPGAQLFGPRRFDETIESSEYDDQQVNILSILGRELPAIHRDLPRLAKVLKRSPHLLETNKHALLAQAGADAVWDALEGSFTWSDESMTPRRVSSMLPMLSQSKQACVLEGCLAEMQANKSHAYLGDNLIVALDICPNWPGWDEALLQCRGFHCRAPKVIERLARELALRAQQGLEARLPAVLEAPLRSRM